MIKHLAPFALVLAIVPNAGAAADKPAFTLPPYAGAYQPQGKDERGLWMELDEQERQFRDAPAILHQPKLTEFVRGVLCRTVGEDRCGSTRVYVVQDASMNAAMAPNGEMLVHTGLLARVHSEAELATVLGHEFAHFERRHTLQHFRALRRATDWVAWLSLGGVVTRTPVASAQSSIVGAVFQFQRFEEEEADRLSTQFVRASPYRLRASIVWKRAMEENDALRTERGLRRVQHLVPTLTDTHPTDLQRFTYLSQIEAEAGDAGEDGVDRYKAATDPLLPLLFQPLIKGNDFAAADYVIRSRGEALGWDGPLLTIRGELYRERGNPRDLVAARDMFEHASAQSNAPAEAWRGLGLCALRLGDADAGRKAIAEYVKRAPSAPDVAILKSLLES
ncbi:MAG: M48 family metalloprotease [Novosphingobium sp.]|nr:M48 family metalloprotease [Novosphingobium sp.]